MPPRLAAALLLVCTFVGCGDTPAPRAAPEPTTTTEIPQEDMREGGRIPEQQHELTEDVAVVRRYGHEHPDEFVDLKFENSTNPVTIVAGFTRDVQEHRAALNQLVAHPDRLTVIAMQHSRQELEGIREELQAEFSGAGDARAYLVGGAFGVVLVRLRADQESTARRLHEKYGDAVEITVGARPYPLPAGFTGGCRPLSAHTPVPGLELRFKTPASIEAGKDGEAAIVARNIGSTTIDHTTGVSLPGYVIERGSDRVVAEPQVLVNSMGVPLRLRPGEEKEVPVRISTANCGAGGGYALARGTYGLIAVHTYGPEARTAMRSEEGTLTVT